MKSKSTKTFLRQLMMHAAKNARINTLLTRDVLIGPLLPGRY